MVLGPRRLFFLIALAAAVAGCSTPKSVLFATREYWWPAFDRNLERQLARLSRDYGYSFRHIPVPADARLSGDLFSEVSDNEQDVIIFDPVLALQVSFDSVPPATLVYLGVSPPAEPFAGAVYVTFDRRPVFEQAGAVCGKLLKEGSFSAPDEEEPRPTRSDKEPKFGILYYPTSADREEEVSYFRSGFLSEAETGLLASRELPNLNNRTFARRLIENMVSDGVVAFLVSALSLTPYCLEVLAKHGLVAVVEDWHPFHGYGDVVLLSISEMYAETLQRVLDSHLQGIHGAVGGVVDLVVGPAGGAANALLESEGAGGESATEKP